MTNQWEPEHYAVFAVLALLVPLLLIAEVTGSHALQFHLLAIVLWCLPIVFALIISASLRTGVVSMRGTRTERKYEPGVYWLLIIAQITVLLFLIGTLLSKPIWNR